MQNEKFFVRKNPGKEIQARRINSIADVPRPFLRYMWISGGMVFLRWNGKKTMAPLGSILFCNYLGDHAINCHLSTDIPEGIIEKDGIFYRKSPVYQAQKISKNLPDFLTSEITTHYNDCCIVTLNAGGGVLRITSQTNGYLVLLGYDKNKRPIVDCILKHNSDEYVICDEKGNFIKELVI